MMQYFKPFHGFVVLVVCLLSSSFGCTIKATLDTTTDATTEFLSSTSGKSW